MSLSLSRAVSASSSIHTMRRLLASSNIIVDHTGTSDPLSFKSYQTRPCLPFAGTCPPSTSLAPPRPSFLATHSSLCTRTNYTKSARRHKDDSTGEHLQAAVGVLDFDAVWWTLSAPPLQHVPHVHLHGHLIKTKPLPPNDV